MSFNRSFVYREQGETMTDKEKLEAITSCFYSGLIQYTHQYGPFEDQTKYLELAKRLATIIESEIKFQNDKQYQRDLMQAWGPQRN